MKNIIAYFKKIVYNIECIYCKQEGAMDIRPGDTLIMKKNHPCGKNEFYVIRSGADFRLKCLGCSREFMVPRSKIENKIRQVISVQKEP